MLERINPFNAGNPMTLKDAFTLSLILSFVLWVLEFFANAEWLVITADPGAWCFEAVKSYIVLFAGSFITLAGLEELSKKVRAGEQSFA